jgi:formiminotetrahydrofolate cyclodeaminase
MTPTQLANLRFIDLLASFRSAEPTPGGGSASALAGAVGASLLTMVAGLPKPRAQNPDDERRLSAAGVRCSASSVELAALMERDSEMYENVVAAFRLPKGSDDEKRVRSDRIQDALQFATEVPLRVMRVCLDGLRAGSEVAALGNANAASDVQVGLELLIAGLRGAKFNVATNLTSIKDQGYIVAAKREADVLERDGERARTAAVALLPSTP